MANISQTLSVISQLINQYNQLLVCFPLYEPVRAIWPIWAGGGENAHCGQHVNKRIGDIFT